MEAASENKRGRGRPPKYPPKYIRKAAAQGPRSLHGQHDRFLADCAIATIIERYPDPDDLRRFSFLFGDIILFGGEHIPAEGFTAKWSLLTELYRYGKQYGEEGFWRAVEWTLRTEPKVKDGIQYLRYVRLTGKSIPPKPDPDATARTIMALLDPFPDHVAYEILSRLLPAYRQEAYRD